VEIPTLNSWNSSLGRNSSTVGNHWFRRCLCVVGGVRNFYAVQHKIIFSIKNSPGKRRIVPCLWGEVGMWYPPNQGRKTNLSKSTADSASHSILYLASSRSNNFRHIQAFVLAIACFIFADVPPTYSSRLPQEVFLSAQYFFLTAVFITYCISFLSPRVLFQWGIHS